MTLPDQVILGSVIGALLGFGFRYLMKFCERHDLIDRHSYVAQYISLAILAVGLTTLLGSDDLLAAFFCGVAFAWDGFFNKQTEESVFSSVIDTLFNIAAFVFVGAWMPFNKFEDDLLTLKVWRLIVIAVLVLLLRRLPIIIALYKWIPDIKTFREAVFSGHFGPIGIGAVFISTLAIEVLHDAQRTAVANGHEVDPAHLTQIEILMDSIQPIVAFMVLCSITIHGLSIPSFSLGRRVHSVSRTWSRRDTMNSTGPRVPEWANQARLVTRREDIVVNRDMDFQKPEVDLEKGENGIVESLDSRTSAEVTIDQSSLAQPDSEKNTGNRTGRESMDQPDGNGQEPSDGTEVISEWKEGSHRVIERHTGRGSDVRLSLVSFNRTDLTANKVEVMVVNDDPSASDAFFPHQRWVGKLHELEGEAKGVGNGIRHVIQQGLKTSQDGGKGSDEKRATPESVATGRDDTRGISEQDDDEGWASEGSDTGEVCKTAAGVCKPRMSKTTAHAHKSRRRSSFRRAHGLTAMMGGDIVEEPRGRDSRPSTAHSSATAVTFAGDNSLSSGKPKHHHVTHSRHSRPGTADTYMSRTSTRPGTGDSSLRNHRVDSIRALHSIPPTRESSPSRSVRFADSNNALGAYVKRGSTGLGDVSGGDTSNNSGSASPVVSPLASVQASRAPSPIPSPGMTDQK